MKVMFTALLLLAAAAFAKPGKTKSECTPFFDRAGSLNFYRQFFEPDSCYLSVSPQDTTSMIFRSYLMTNDGLFMVFNSFGQGGTGMTGARDYFFFPRTRLPWAKAQDGTISVQSASPLATINFNADLGVIQSMDNGEVSVAPEIIKENAGGVEITKFNGLMLDAGFAMDHDPVTEKDRTVYFQDHEGNKCSVKVAEVFKFSGGEVYLPDDAAIKQFLSARCPQIKVKF